MSVPLDPFPMPPLEAQVRMVEALLFASAEPLTTAQIRARLPGAPDPVAALERLARKCEGRGVVLERCGEGWAFRTAPDLSYLLVRERIERRALSRPALETLAVIAYHQPATRAEIEEVRGVSVSRGTLERLMELGWVGLGRRRETPGRPVTFVVTRGFLDHFGLTSARDLPGLKELRAAGLLDPDPSAPGGATASADTEEELRPAAE
jgi:segregation and condensation protein B